MMIICTDIGGRSYLYAIKTDIIGKFDKIVWTVSPGAAMQFNSIGELAQYFAFIPIHFEAYEEDIKFLKPNLGIF